MLTEITLPDGSKRRLGNNGSWGPKPRFLAPIPIKAYTRDELLALAGTDLDSDFIPQEPHDQDGAGMCNASATCGAAESQRLKQGLPYVALSGGDLYGRINGGIDQGSMLEDGIVEAMAGVAPVSVAPYLSWRNPNANARAVAERPKYKVLEAYLCPTFAACATAVALGFDLITGIMWGDGDNPDGQGWLPTRARGNVGGHAIHGYKLVKRGNSLGIAHQNSWGRTWGLAGKGLFVIPEERYAGPVGGWWAVRAVADEGGVVPGGK